MATIKARCRFCGARVMYFGEICQTCEDSINDNGPMFPTEQEIADAEGITLREMVPENEDY